MRRPFRLGSRITIPYVLPELREMRAQMGREPDSVHSIETVKGGEPEREQVGEEVVREIVTGGPEGLRFCASAMFLRINSEIRWICTVSRRSDKNQLMKEQYR